MKLKKLWIKEYKNLENFEINFEKTTSNINVLIGKNGSGKSNLIEAICLIFKYLQKEPDSMTVFQDFFLEYELQEKNIKIERKTGQGYKCQIDNEEFNIDGFLAQESKGVKLFPENIVVTYSGFNKRLEDYLKRYEKDQNKLLAKGIFEKKNVYYYRPEMFPFGLWSLLSIQGGDTKEFLKEYCEIDGIDRISLKIKAPSYGNNKEDFFGAKGIVRDFLKVLKNNAFSTTDKEVNSFVLKYDIKKDDKFIENILYSLPAGEYHHSHLFNLFDALYYSDMVEEVFLHVSKNGKSINYTLLSEGEQQMITMKILLECFGYNESLYLFDEPDTFLHPKWQRDLIPTIEKIGGESQIIITTHSPLTISKVQETEIFIIDKGKIYSTEVNSFERDISGILSGIMDVPERSDEMTLLFEKFYKNIALKSLEAAQNSLEEILKTGIKDTDPFFVKAEILIERLERAKNETNNKR